MPVLKVPRKLSTEAGNAGVDIGVESSSPLAGFNLSLKVKL
ncbi:MAG: hypothetical protein ACOC7P_03060 [Chloroflexota bacterium]